MLASNQPVTAARLGRAGSPAAAYVAPFAAFIAIMALEHTARLPMLWAYPLRIAVTLALLLLLSRPYLSLRPSAALASALLGIAVFFVWIGPDFLFHYRYHWLFSNSVMGQPATSMPPDLQRSLWFLALRTAACALVVPVVEELFWRGWLMRWLIHKEFLKVPIGAYAPSAFWFVALMFASEHGPYWEVGLITGILYNWWVIRTRNLADCILAHAVTNACLSAYVLATGNWQYWL